MTFWEWASAHPWMTFIGFLWAAGAAAACIEAAFKARGK